MKLSIKRKPKVKTYKVVEDFRYDKTDYKFQPQLTPILDKKANLHFNQNTINQIVLWKTNRYASLSVKALSAINSIPKNKGPHDPSVTRKVLKVLLNENGIRLPMASTILRFKNPNTYQIIDQRAYRFAGFREQPLTTHKSEKNNNSNIEIYIKYLDRLRTIAQQKNLKFAVIDRIFYKKDRNVNKRIRIKYSSSTSTIGQVD